MFHLREEINVVVAFTSKKHNDDYPWLCKLLNLQTKQASGNKAAF